MAKQQAKTKVGEWSATTSAPGSVESVPLIVLDKLLERLPAAKLRPILNGCVPDCGFVAFRPFLRHPQAAVVFDGSTTQKWVTSPSQKMLESDQDDAKKFVLDLLGFPGALVMAYRMHAVAVMAPHDWWNCIVQCISQQINLEHMVKRDDPNVVSALQQSNITARVSKPAVHTWLKEIEVSVYRGMTHKTELMTLLQRGFSTSNDVSDLGNLNSAVCAFKHRVVPDWDSSFRDRNFLCGLYGIKMLGGIEDWQKLRRSFENICNYLRGSSEDYGIETPWLEEIRYILDLLVRTFEHHGKHSDVRRFWKSMLSGESVNCDRGSELRGWLSYLFSCRVIEPKIDLRAINIDFSVSCLPFTVEAFGCTDDYELCTGIAGYSMKYNRDYDRWFVEPRHECCLFKY